MSNQTSQSGEQIKIIIHCVKCGQKLSIPRRTTKIQVRCPKCLHEFDYQHVPEKAVGNTAEAVLANLSQKTSKNVCPVCHKDDQLIKVVSIVESGTHNISGTTNEWQSDNYGGYWAT